MANPLTTDRLDSPSHSGLHRRGRVRLHTPDAQTASSGVALSIDWTNATIDYEQGGTWFSAGSPTILTVPFTGFCIIHGQIKWAVDNSGVRIARILLNGTDLRAAQHVPAPQLGNTGLVQTATQDLLTAGDTIALVAVHDGPATLDTVASDDLYLAVYLLGDPF